MSLAARRTRRNLFTLALLLLCVACAGIATRRLVTSTPYGPDRLPCPSPADFRLITLNLAHGRGLAFHQVIVGDDAFAHNIEAVGALLRASCPDVVALQEADGPSAWSGHFDHVATLASMGDFHTYFRGTHARVSLFGIEIVYGTALLARAEMHGAASRAFATSGSDTKGYVRARVTVPSRPMAPIDVTSVHLHPFDKSVRNRQIEALVAELAVHTEPLVVMGDFNCGWTGSSGCARTIAERLGLSAFAPTDGLATFPSHRATRRIDWILVAPSLEVVAYHTLSTPVSDHLAVVADVRWRHNPEPLVARDDLTVRSDTR